MYDSKQDSDQSSHFTSAFRPTQRSHISSMTYSLFFQCMGQDKCGHWKLQIYHGPLYNFTSYPHTGGPSKPVVLGAGLWQTRVLDLLNPGHALQRLHHGETGQICIWPWHNPSVHEGIFGRYHTAEYIWEPIIQRWQNHKPIFPSCIAPIIQKVEISSLESQKGAIANERCSVENQKGAIAEGRYCHWLCTAIAPFWFSTEHLWAAI